MLGYALTIFLGAFLLFQVQPMIGKFVLPWFGGSPLAWATCMMFFQILLLAGYAYAHFLTKVFSPRRQSRLHLALLVASFAFLPVLPSDSWKPAGDESAIVRILLLLAATLGAPFLLLSATGPLLQSWFSRSHPGRSPYRLYALSNVASLLALLSYPFFIEPALPLRLQTYLWSGAFVIFAGCCGWCAFSFQKQQDALLAGAQPNPEPQTPAPSFFSIMLWLLLPAAGSIILLATTNRMTQDVAVVPFLWILPLGIYLVSFILCFDSPRWYWRPFWSAALALAVGCAYVGPSLRISTPLFLQLAIYSFTLFVCCMICHGELVRLKPAASHLTLFYFFVSAGGALGGIFVNLVAPLIFKGFWEYQVGIGICCVLFLVMLYADRDSRLYDGRPRFVWVLLLAALGGVSALFVKRINSEFDEAIAASRSFFGVLRVDTRDEGTRWAARHLIHGRIAHGYQLVHENYRGIPVSYYGPRSGIGIAEMALHRRRDGNGNFKPVRTGVVGLGAGVMATYGFEGDTLRFYEIDPNVVRVSREYFSYTRNSPAKVEVVLGDARISMERERARGEAQQFDVLVLDAFSGDGIPLHLLTKQAFELYGYHLKPDGLLAIHISNKYLNLQPLVRGLAAECGKEALLFVENPGRSGIFDPNTWVLVTSDREFLESWIVEEHAEPWPGDAPPPLLFTDDYSNLFKLLDR